MNSLKLTNFKAHQDLEEIKFDGKNFLLYGDNVRGKVLYMKP
jgi:recombinational DNA repair ATPase RecF